MTHPSRWGWGAPHSWDGKPHLNHWLQPGVAGNTKICWHVAKPCGQGCHPKAASPPPLPFQRESFPKNAWETPFLSFFMNYLAVIFRGVWGCLLSPWLIVNLIKY